MTANRPCQKNDLKQALTWSSSKSGTGLSVAPHLRKRAMANDR